MMMTRKTLFVNLGLAIALVGSVAASERHRVAGTSGSPDGSAIAKPTVEGEIIADGVMLAKVNGTQYKIYADGRVSYDEMIAAFGGPERFSFARSRQAMPSAMNTEKGMKMYADGAVSFDEAKAANKVTGSTSGLMAQVETDPVAELKASTQWLEQDFNGTTVTIFANGVVLNNASLTQRVPRSMMHQQTVPSIVDQKGVRRFADGAVFADPENLAAANR